MRPNSSKWYLLRTKQYKEPLVQAILSRSVADTFLPRLRSVHRIWGKLTPTVSPMFPCYLFASFDVDRDYDFVRRTAGVVGVLCAGSEPIEVDPMVIDEIKTRGQDGVVDLSRYNFSAGQSVCVLDGPLRGISAVFERYLSGSERAALLVDLIGKASVRVILSPRLIAPTDVRNS